MSQMYADIQTEVQDIIEYEYTTKQEWAHYHARKGYPVFPCIFKGKKPLTKHGFKDASTDESIIQQWWNQWPDANIGIPTGRISGIVVLDVDPRHDGHNSLVALQEDFNKLPDTITVLTGGGGYHFWFEHPDNQLISNATNLANLPGLDIKADGGYVIGPGSTHESGKPYVWEISSSPEIVNLAPLPDWFLRLLHSDISNTSCNKRGWVVGALAGTSQGKRNATAIKLAGYFKNLLPYDVTLEIMNLYAERCVPPLEYSEVFVCVQSAYKYEQENLVNKKRRQF